MKKFLMLPLLAFALFACENNETENETNFNNVESSVNQSNLWERDLWYGYQVPTTISMNLEVTSLLDWDNVLVVYTTYESRNEFDVETTFHEIEARTVILKVGDTLQLTDVFTNPDEDESLHLSIVPYLYGDPYYDASEEVFIQDPITSLDGKTYDVKMLTTYEEYLGATTVENE